ncbi:MAG: tRNA adenosine(34) deaminase TadA [Phycisphaerae bacterium]|nr:tRNA adenosine(34) deaminase TadA [Phycisphaerae bacterium]
MVDVHKDNSNSLDLPGQDRDEYFMKQAVNLAIEALEHDEVPVGAVIVREGRIIGRGFNQRQMLADPTAHAEILAITAAAEAVGDWRLTGCTLYVTLEPCLMCAGAIILARIDRVVYGATDPKAGAVESLYQVLSDTRLNHQPQLRKGVMEADSAALLVEFFRKQRAMGKK